MSYYEYQTTPRYVQCEDALKEIKRYTFGLGKNFLIVTACGPITDMVTAKMKNSFDSPMSDNMNSAFYDTNHKYAGYQSAAKILDQEEVAINYYFLDYETKPITYSTAKTLGDYIVEKNIDVIIGVGGGKGMDFARAATHFASVKVVLVPTSASTNASVSQMCVVYNEDGSEIEDFWYMPRPQDLVLVDTNLLIGAPARNLAAGIGDCISTYYEAQNVLAVLNRRQYYSDLTWDVIECSINILLKNGKKAIEAAEQHVITREYESVVSQILHNCGPIRAITGVGFAHVLDEALICFPECRKQLHGLLVGYATIAMKVFGREPLEDIHQYIDFCLEIGIPVCFEQIGLKGITKEALAEKCEIALKGTTVKAFPIEVSIDQIVNAAFGAEEIVQEYLKTKN